MQLFIIEFKVNTSIIHYSYLINDEVRLGDKIGCCDEQIPAEDDDVDEFRHRAFNCRESRFGSPV